jgi:hypothetical protein
MENSNDTIGNRTRNLPACSAVPQPTAAPRALTPRSTLKNSYVRSQVMVDYRTYSDTAYFSQRALYSNILQSGTYFAQHLYQLTFMTRKDCCHYM